MLGAGPGLRECNRDAILFAPSTRPCCEGSSGVRPAVTGVCWAPSLELAGRGQRYRVRFPRRTVSPNPMASSLACPSQLFFPDSSRCGLGAFTRHRPRNWCRYDFSSARDAGPMAFHAPSHTHVRSSPVPACLNADAPVVAHVARPERAPPATPLSSQTRIAMARTAPMSPPHR